MRRADATVYPGHVDRYHGKPLASRERRLVADQQRPALGTADRKPASQDVVLNVSKVAPNSSARAPGIGHNRSPVTRSESSLLARLG
jgi:hypothetical protein